MKIEILYPELCSLFGDGGNLRYLEACLPEAEIVRTPLGAAPLFATEQPALVLMGPMSERSQELALSRLEPFREPLRDRMDSGACMLFTGNAVELLGQEIREGDRRTPCLGLLDLTTRRDMEHRHNSLFLGKFEDMDIVGFHSRFAQGESGETGLFRVVRGSGSMEGATFEGVRRNNLFGTWLLGPLLPLNPDFTLYLLRAMGVKSPKLAFEAEAREAFRLRLAEFRDTRRKLD